MLLRNWFDNLKVMRGLHSLPTLRRRSTPRRRNFTLYPQAAEVCEERRLLSAGALDPTFGSGGTATPNATVKGGATAIAVDSSSNSTTAGDTIVAGTVNLPNGTHEFGIVRYSPNGIPDSTFGGKNGGGEVIVAFGSSYGNDYAQDVAIQSNGKVVVAGWAGGITAKGSSEDFAVARLNGNGTLDTTFGAGGTVTTNFTGGT